MPLPEGPWAGRSKAIADVGDAALGDLAGDGGIGPADRCWPVRGSKQDLLQRDADHSLPAARKIDVYATNKANLL
jgi:hypothetical protein